MRRNQIEIHSDYVVIANYKERNISLYKEIISSLEKRCHLHEGVAREMDRCHLIPSFGVMDNMRIRGQRDM